MIIDNAYTIHKMLQIHSALSCPHCNSSRFIRYGKVFTIQRYKCKACHKQFKDTTNTPLHWIHKTGKIDKYLAELTKGTSIRKSANKVGISTTTAFNWRHKFLSSLTSNTHTNIENQTNQTTRISIIHQSYSCKGRKKNPEKYQCSTASLFTNTNQQYTLHKLPHQTKSSEIRKILTQTTAKQTIAIKPDKLFKNAVNKNPDLVKMHNNWSKKNEQIKIHSEIQKLYKWMERFRGVATKYLQQYWNWYTNLQNSRIFTLSTETFIEKCCTNRSREYFFQLKDA